MSKWRARAALALKVVVTAVLCLLLINWIDWPQFWSSVRSIDPLIAVLGFIVLASGYPLSAWKWQAILRVYNVRTSFIELTRIYMIAAFLGQFLPTAIGGDVYRATMTRKAAGGWTTSITAIFVERVSGILALALLGYVAAALVWLKNGHPLAGVILTIGTIAGVAGAIILLSSTFFRVPGWLARIAFVRNLSQILAGSFDLWRRRPGELALVTALSLFFHMLKILVAWLFFEALGSPVDPLTLAVAILVVELAGVLPISIGGIGVMEGSFVAVMALFGVDEALALAVILIVRVIAVLITLVGALMFLSDQRSRQLVRERPAASI